MRLFGQKERKSKWLDDQGRNGDISSGLKAFRQLAQHSNMIMGILRPDGYCTYLNSRWFEFTGQSWEDGRGLGWMDAVHDGDREQVGVVYDEAMRARAPFYLDYRLLHAGHGYSWVMGTGQPYFDVSGVHEAYTCVVKVVGETVQPAEHAATPGASSRPAGLSRREKETLAWIARGKTADEISTILGIAARTVEYHYRSASLKLGTVNRVQTVVEAIRRAEIEL